MLEMIDVSKIYPGGSVALQDINVRIEQGEFVFIVGPSGAGKSTFFKMLFREVLPSSGKVIVNGHDLVKMTDKEIPYFRRQLGIVFQDYRLLPDRTVYDNVAFAMQVIETPYRKIKRRVNDVLDLVGLRKRAHAYPTELSGGEQQRIAIARAIVNDPILLIADEPTGNLDPETSWEIMDIFREVNKSGTTIVMATHDREIVDEMDMNLKTGNISCKYLCAIGFPHYPIQFIFYMLFRKSHICCILHQKIDFIILNSVCVLNKFQFLCHCCITDRTIVRIDRYF